MQSTKFAVLACMITLGFAGLSEMSAMASVPVSSLQKQVNRVSRRLFLQIFVDTLALCWGGALLLSTLWFVLDPLIPGNREEWVRWVVCSGLFLCGTFAALGIACLRAPSRLMAALSLDSRFNLKERATTALTLSPELHTQPAALALLEDANQRVAALNIGEGFPVRIRWSAALVPVGCLLLAIVALFYDPSRGQANPNPPEAFAKTPLSQEIENKIKEIKEKREKKAAEKFNGDKPDPMDDELKNILNKPRENKEEVRDRVKELTKLEDALKAKQDALTEKAQAMRDQLNQMNKMAGMDPKDGPAKDLQKAIEKGDFKQAREELERIAKKMEKGEFTEKEKEQLREQVKRLQEKTRQAADPKAAEEKLQELRREGKISQDQFDKAMEQVKKNADQMSKDEQKKMEELADALKECEACMKSGDGDKAADALRKAGQAMRKMDDLDEMSDLAEQLDQARDARRSMCKGMNGNPVPAEGRRPEGDPHETRSYSTRVKGDFDPKGQKELTGFAPGAAFKKRSSAEVAGEIKQASQDAPEALERQRIPRAATDMARGYFENFRKLSGGEEEKK